MKAAEVFVKSLEYAGVEYVFGVPGEENLAFVEALRKSSIKLITTRHEQSAVFMAATIGRLTGRVGVAMSTLGPGATNLVTGVAYAQLGGMPVMVVTGQKPIKQSRQGKFQIIDVVGMMKPITKSSETVVSADKIPSLVHQAIRLAESERPGAVHIELPEDIAEEETSTQPIAWQKVRRPIADEKSITALVDALNIAQKPLFVVAAGANRKLIGKQLINVVSKTKIPFVTTQMGKGVAPENSDYYLGTTALSDGDFVHQAIASADLVIMLGHDTIEKPPSFHHDKQKVVHVNFYMSEIDNVYEPDLEVVGDIAHTLWEVSRRLDRDNYWQDEDITNYKNKQLADSLDQSNSENFPLKPQRVVKDLRDILPYDSILSLDNGMYKLWISRNYPALEQNSVLLDNALATMGAGLPAGMAAKMLNPEKPVVVVAGDGGFVMNMSDLETAVRLNLDLVIVILNDSGYGMIKWKQQSMGLTDYGLDFKNPDFIKLAESFGATGHRVKSASDFKEYLQKAIGSGGVHIIDTPIDYSENIKLDSRYLSQHTKGDI